MKKAISIIAFISIFVLAFSYADRLLSRKETEGWWNVTEKIDGFYNSPKNEYDVIFYGSSNAYCSFNPLTIWEKTGVKSYVFATQQQPSWATYHYMVDSLKTQKPKLAVVDVLMFAENKEFYDDGVNYTFCDNMPMSLNKLRLITASAPRDDWFNLAVRFTKYHSRWSELTRADFEYRKSEMNDYSKGFYVLTDTCKDGVHTDMADVLDSTPLFPKNREYLDKIIELCKNEKIELLLLKTPSNSTKEQKMYYNSVENIAKEQGISFVDYNEKYDEIGLDLSADFFDKTHLNFKGADKFSAYFVDNTAYFDGKTRADNDWEDEYNTYWEATKNF